MLLRMLNCLVMALCLVFLPALAFADDGDAVNMELPSHIKVEKKTDLSAAVLKRLFGASWTDFAGENEVADAVDTFSGLIVSILGVLNLAAMIYVSSMIIYLWGVFAVTTAHKGQSLGGGVYNSLWVPVRHAMSFTLTVPVVNGLSMMQVIIIGCVGLSINFANVIWDAAGGYLIEHANVGIIDSSIPMVEQNAYEMIPVMFKDSATQNIFLQSGDKWHKDSYNKAEHMNISFPNSGKLLEIDDSIKGASTLMARPTEKSQMAKRWWGSKYDASGYDIDVTAGAPTTVVETDFGTFQSTKTHLSYTPTFQYFGAIHVEIPRGDNQTDTFYKLKSDIAQKKLEHIRELWAVMDQDAIDYLDSPESVSGHVGAGCASGNCKNVNKKELQEATYKAINDFAANVTKDIDEIVKNHINNDSNALKEIRDKLRKAIDADPGKGSNLGWMSAGLFTFGLSSVQRQFSESVVTPIWVTYGEDPAETFGERFEGNAKAGLQNITRYFSNVMMNNQRYATQKQAEEGGIGLADKVESTIMAAFLGKQNTSDRKGILDVVLSEFSTHDPMIVLQTMGQRLYNAITGWGGASVIGGAGLLSWGLDKIGLGFSLWPIIGGIAILAVISAFFAYVVPIIPLIFWLKALMSWIFMVVEAMVAAPFWVCTHALPEGHGFAGNHARRGYMMLLDILIRPTLLVIGAVFAVAICQALGHLFGVLFNAWFANISGSFIQIGFLADIIYSLIVASLMYYATYTIFTTGINYMPEHVLRWCGAGMAMGLQDEGQGTKEILMAGGMLNRGKSLAGSVGNLKIGMPSLPGK